MLCRLGYASDCSYPMIKSSTHLAMHGWLVSLAIRNISLDRANLASIPSSAASGYASLTLVLATNNSHSGRIFCQFLRSAGRLLPHRSCTCCSCCRRLQIRASDWSKAVGINCEYAHRITKYHVTGRLVADSRISCVGIAMALQHGREISMRGPGCVVKAVACWLVDVEDDVGASLIEI